MSEKDLAELKKGLEEIRKDFEAVFSKRTMAWDFYNENFPGDKALTAEQTWATAKTVYHLLPVMEEMLDRLARLIRRMEQRD